MQRLQTHSKVWTVADELEEDCSSNLDVGQLVYVGVQEDVFIPGLPCAPTDNSEMRAEREQFLEQRCFMYPAVVLFVTKVAPAPLIFDPLDPPPPLWFLVQDCEDGLESTRM
jgi:hypothetical protein